MLRFLGVPSDARAREGEPNTIIASAPLCRVILECRGRKVRLLWTPPILVWASIPLTSTPGRCPCLLDL